MVSRGDTNGWASRRAVPSGLLIENGDESPWTPTCGSLSRVDCSLTQSWAPAWRNIDCVPVLVKRSDHDGITASIPGFSAADRP